LISPETFRFTVAEMLTGNFEVRPDDDQDTPNDPGAIFYFTFAERKEFAALDFLEVPVALALDSALVRLHERATREYTALVDAAEVSAVPSAVRADPTSTWPSVPWRRTWHACTWPSAPRRNGEQTQKATTSYRFGITIEKDSLFARFN
jgi:hypothetical protein